MDNSRDSDIDFKIIMKTLPAFPHSMSATWAMPRRDNPANPVRAQFGYLRGTSGITEAEVAIRLSGYTVAVVQYQRDRTRRQPPPRSAEVIIYVNHNNTIRDISRGPAWQSDK